MLRARSAPGIRDKRASRRPQAAPTERTPRAHSPRLAFRVAAELARLLAWHAQNSAQSPRGSPLRNISRSSSSRSTSLGSDDATSDFGTSSGDELDSQCEESSAQAEGRSAEGSKATRLQPPQRRRSRSSFADRPDVAGSSQAATVTSLAAAVVPSAAVALAPSSQNKGPTLCAQAAEGAASTDRQSSKKRVSLAYSEDPFNDDVILLTLSVGAQTHLEPRLSVAPEAMRGLKADIRFVAEPELPKSLVLHPKSGVISGVLSKAQVVPSEHKIEMMTNGSGAGGASLPALPVACCTVAICGRGQKLEGK